MNEYDYTGNRVQNYFTAYLQQFIRRKRWDYLKKKEKVRHMERPLDGTDWESGIGVEETMEMNRKEELLLKEREAVYPEWDELSDQRLVSSLMMLSEEERRLIYQHVFEERTFKEMEELNGLPDERIKGVYYYAVRKIRRWMGGGK